MAIRITTPGEGQNQNKNRIVKLFFDQHRNLTLGYPDGRAWWGYCEKQVDGSDAAPVGELMPVSADMVLLDGTVIKGWDAPWVPEPKYVTMAVAGLAGNRFRIDYVRMQRDYEAANRTYYDLVNNEVFQKGWEAVPLYAPVPYVVRALKHIGAPPKSPKLPEAALAGDRWLLGYSREVNEQLAQVLATDNGRLSHTPEETPPQGTQANPLANLSSDDLAEITTMLADRRRAKAMRDAKAAKSTSTQAV